MSVCVRVCVCSIAKDLFLILHFKSILIKRSLQNKYRLSLSGVR